MNSIIIVKTIMINEIKYIPLFTIQLITIHLGKNPMNGGRPPNDRKLIINVNLFSLLLFIEFESCFK
jgi:hypothetical protein